MDDYIARQPILNVRARVCGYHLQLGRKTHRFINETAAGFSEIGTAPQSSCFRTTGEFRPYRAYLEYSDALAGSSTRIPRRGTWPPEPSSFSARIPPRTPTSAKSSNQRGSRWPLTAR
jgi:hypothetical protein